MSSQKPLVIFESARDKLENVLIGIPDERLEACVETVRGGRAWRVKTGVVGDPELVMLPAGHLLSAEDVRRFVHFQVCGDRECNGWKTVRVSQVTKIYVNDEGFNLLKNKNILTDKTLDCLRAGVKIRMNDCIVTNPDTTEN